MLTCNLKTTFIIHHIIRELSVSYQTACQKHLYDKGYSMLVVGNEPSLTMYMVVDSLTIKSATRRQLLLRSVEAKMDIDEFRRRGKEMIDYAADYLENIRSRKPMSQVKPGYLKELLPDEAPEEGEKWNDIFGDVERVIMPGVTHWTSPYFHAYYGAANSYPAICADILSNAIGCIGFSWIASPVCTELEMLMMKWLGKMLKLPLEFYESEQGGGVIQGSASESLYVSLLSARSKKMNELKGEIDFTKMVMYCSDQAHTCSVKAGLIALVKCRKIRSDDRHNMEPKLLQKAITEDKKNGLIPFFCVATLGTTSICSFDNLREIGPICNKENIWLHIDAAYAGSAFICPEFRHLLDGVEHADSFNFNPHKWLQVNFDCSALWLKNSRHLVDSFNVDAVFLQHETDDKVVDYRRWQIPFGRRFRSLKLWFVLRSFGITGLQQNIRKDVSLAKEFEKLVSENEHFEIVNEVILGLVCFRLKGPNEDNELLVNKLLKDGRIYLVPGMVKGMYYLRFAICAASTAKKDIEYSWNVILEVATPIIHSRI